MQDEERVKYVIEDITIYARNYQEALLIYSLIKN